MIGAFADWVAATNLSETIRSSTWMFQTIESVHVLAITTVVGMIAIMDLRLLGVPSRKRSVTEIGDETLPWVWGAFFLAVISGVLMFIANAQAYAANTEFLIKMGLIALAGLNMLYFQFAISGTMRNWDVDVASPRAAKMAAFASLCLWVGVVTFGRLIGFTLDMLAGTDFSQYVN